MILEVAVVETRGPIDSIAQRTGDTTIEIQEVVLEEEVASEVVEGMETVTADGVGGMILTIIVTVSEITTETGVLREERDGVGNDLWVR